jgi:hypothetical protein
MYIEGRRIAQPSITELELTVLQSQSMQLNSVILEQQQYLRVKVVG